MATSTKKTETKVAQQRKINNGKAISKNIIDKGKKINKQNSCKK